MDTRIELEAKTDRELLILVATQGNELCSQVRAQNGRIRSLEDWRSYITGALALLGLAVVVIGGWLLGKV